MKTLLEFCTPRTTPQNEHPFAEDAALVVRLKKVHEQQPIDLVFLGYTQPNSLVRKYSLGNKIKPIGIISILSNNHEQELQSHLFGSLARQEERCGYLSCTPLSDVFKNWCAEHEIHYQKA
ncbi:MAG TPA: hypothetical protein VJK51_03075 [Candidatus Nanoarchaeia archaeon]|nr:hypothetical protein [Candidatus Nanoarchaeia archaeon]